MWYVISSWFLFFFLYSVIGYIAEIAFVSIKTKKIVFNRGFLIGPYLPIYGFGSLILILFLRRYEEDPVVLFVLGAVFCTTLEYFTSLIMEKIFKLRWWDYGPDILKNCDITDIKAALNTISGNIMRGMKKYQSKFIEIDGKKGKITVI